MPLPIALLTGVLSALAAIALTPWLGRLARTDSAWLGIRLHVALAGLGGVGTAVLARSWAELTAFALLALASSLLVVVDLAAYRLPDLIVGPMYPILLVGLTVAAATSSDWGRLGRAAIAGAALALGYFVLALISPSGLGLGDVKLSGLLGVFLGWLGWSHAIVGTLAAFCLNGVVAAVLLLVTNLTRRGDIAFGPWMVTGAAVGAAWGPAVLRV